MHTNHNPSLKALQDLSRHRPLRSVLASRWVLWSVSPVLHSLEQVSRVIGPVLGGLAVLSVALGLGVFGLVAAALYAICLGFLSAVEGLMWWSRRRSPLACGPARTEAVLRYVLDCPALVLLAKSWLDQSGCAAFTPHELALFERFAKTHGVPLGSPIVSGGSSALETPTQDDVFFDAFPASPGILIDSRDPYSLLSDYFRCVAIIDGALGHVEPAKARAKAQRMDVNLQPCSTLETKRARL